MRECCTPQSNEVQAQEDAKAVEQCCTIDEKKAKEEINKESDCGCGC